MGQSSGSGIAHWIYIDDDAFEADYPVDTGQAWVMRNNLAHLQDSAGQFRINWMAKPGRADAISFPTGTSYWAIPFLCTMYGQTQLPGMDIRIAGAVATGGESYTINARIIADDRTVPVWSTKGEALWSSAAGNVTSTTGAWGVDETNATALNSVSPTAWEGGRQTVPINEDGTSHAAIIVALRLEAKIVATTSTSVYICGCQVREYPVWW